MYAAELKFKSESEYTVFVHEPGAEIWMYTSFWPSKPLLYELGPEVSLADIALEKSIFHKGKNCRSDPNYDPYGTYYYRPNLLLTYSYNLV